MQLAKAKRQLTGQMIISAESNVNRMLTLGKSILTFNKAESTETVVNKIEAVSASQILETANEILNKDNLSTLIYK